MVSLKSARQRSATIDSQHTFGEPARTGPARAPLGVRSCPRGDAKKLGSALCRFRIGRPAGPVRAGSPNVCWESIVADRYRRFERNHFRKWFGRRLKADTQGRRTADNSRGPIVLLDDCLTSYCEPGVNRAAVRVLEAAGYEVHLAGLAVLRSHAGLPKAF